VKVLTIEETQDREYAIEKLSGAIGNLRPIEPHFDCDEHKHLFIDEMIVENATAETIALHLEIWDEAWRRSLEKDRWN